MPSKITFPVVPASSRCHCCSQDAFLRQQKPVAVIPQPPVAPVAPAGTRCAAPDPIAVLIASSDAHFEAGRKELALGHLERAKAEFDRALDALLESPDGARDNPRLREHFDRLVDRISVLEQAALTTGDGFSETKSEPAAIDTLLAEPRGDGATEAGHRRSRPGRSRSDDARHSDPDQRSGAALR